MQPQILRSCLQPHLASAQNALAQILSIPVQSMSESHVSWPILKNQYNIFLSFSTIYQQGKGQSGGSQIYIKLCKQFLNTTKSTLPHFI